MLVTMIMTALASGVALGVWVTGGLGHKVWFERTGYLAWFGLVACFGLLSMEQMHGASALLATASFAATSMLTTVERERWGGVRTGGVLAVVLGLCGVILAANSYYEPVVPDRNLVLFAGQWGALAAAGVASLLAVSYDERGEEWSSGLLISMLAGGALWMGTMRSALPGWGYAVELSSADQPVRWALPAITPGASSFAFDVTQQVPGVDGVLMLGIIAGLVGAGAVLWGRRALARLAYGVAALAGGVSLGMVLRTGFNAALPDVAPYVEHARNVGLEKRVPEQVLALGRFEYGETIYVLWLDVLGDVGLLTALVLCAVVGMIRQHHLLGRERVSAITSQAKHAPLGRLFGARAAGLLWLGWILGLFINWRLHAIYGVGSATEWTLLGAAVVASGAVLCTSLEDVRARRAAYALVMLALMFAIVLSLVFEVPPGVVMS